MSRVSEQDDGDDDNDTHYSYYFLLLQYLYSAQIQANSSQRCWIYGL